MDPNTSLGDFARLPAEMRLKIFERCLNERRLLEGSVDRNGMLSASRQLSEESTVCLYEGRELNFEFNSSRGTSIKEALLCSISTRVYLGRHTKPKAFKALRRRLITKEPSGDDDIREFVSKLPLSKFHDLTVTLYMRCNDGWEGDGELALKWYQTSQLVELLKRNSNGLPAKVMIEFVFPRISSARNLMCPTPPDWWKMDWQMDIFDVLLVPFLQLGGCIRRRITPKFHKSSRSLFLMRDPHTINVTRIQMRQLSLWADMKIDSVDGVFGTYLRRERCRFWDREYVENEVSKIKEVFDQGIPGDSERDERHANARQRCISALVKRYLVLRHYHPVGQREWCLGSGRKESRALKRYITENGDGLDQCHKFTEMQWTRTFELIVTPQENEFSDDGIWEDSVEFSQTIDGDAICWCGSEQWRTRDGPDHSIAAVRELVEKFDRDPDAFVERLSDTVPRSLEHLEDLTSWWAKGPSYVLRDHDKRCTSLMASAATLEGTSFAPVPATDLKCRRCGRSSDLP